MRLEPARILLFARRLLVLGTVAGGAYLWARYEWVTLPDEGCSPLVALAPGTTMLFDTRPRRLAVGSVVLFEGPDGQLLLGEIADPDRGPAERPPGALWVLTDDPDCPGLDSRTLGWIAPEAVRGRMVFAHAPPPAPAGP